MTSPLPKDNHQRKLQTKLDGLFHRLRENERDDDGEENMVEILSQTALTLQEQAERLSMTMSSEKEEEENGNVVEGLHLKAYEVAAKMKEAYVRLSAFWVFVRKFFALSRAGRVPSFFFSIGLGCNLFARVVFMVMTISKFLYLFTDTIYYNWAIAIGDALDYWNQKGRKKRNCYGERRARSTRKRLMLG